MIARVPRTLLDHSRPPKPSKNLNTNQRIKLLQIALQYTLPRLQATVIEEEKNNFDEPFTINVLERDHNTGEVVVKNEYKIDPFQA